MNAIKRILYFLSLFLLFVIFKECVELIALAKSFHPAIGWLVFAALTGFVIYFVAIPIYKIIRIPVNRGPVSDEAEVPDLLAQRFQLFRQNPHHPSTQGG